MPRPGSQLPGLDHEALVDENGVSRRGFVGVVTWGAVAAALAACGGGSAPTNPGAGGPGGGTNPETLPAGVMVNGNVVTVDLTQQPGLAGDKGFLLIAASVRVFAINLGSNTFRAFTSICTHQGCNVETFSNGRINCPCHGSQYNTSGQPVAGPAPLPLTEYTATFTAPSTLTINKG